MLTENEVKQIADILEEEANQLAKWFDDNKKTISNRAIIACLREINRLRILAQRLKEDVLPQTDNVPEG